MRSLLQLLFISLLPVVAFSQTLEEKQVITKDYNTELLDELAKSLKSKAEFEKNKALELAQQNGWFIRKEEDGKLFELMKVSEEGNPIYYTTNNVNAAKSTRANTLHNGGILGLNVEGQNMKAHVWDGGLARITHQEYDGPGGSNTFSIGDGTTATHWHSAHVTGTIIASGYVANAKGMAPQADAVGYEWNNDVSEATTAANNGMLLSNHSYGLDATAIPDWYFGAYMTYSRDWDIIMYNAPYYLMVASAGNDGNDNTSNGIPLDGNIYYDKLSYLSTVKNNLVVANANDANIDANGNLVSVSINSSSSEGPTDDYRIKPDITGNGTTLYSTLDNSNSSYGTASGTSMSSPNVTGTLLLLQQHYNNLNSGFMRAATLKGLALHTADDAGPTGPDAVWGWGLLNGKEAANVITNNGGTSNISELTLNQGGSYSINVVSDGINDLIASISWTDPAGTANTGTANDKTPVLVNDLDIRVTQGGSTYYPYRLINITTNGTGDNIVDPFEKIIISGASGTYTITVTHKGSLTSGTQAYSLIISGKSSVNPPVADFSASNTMPINSSTWVNFTDASTNSPTYYAWSFSPTTVTYQGGTNANTQNPTVSFNQPGAYTVSLYVYNSAGNDTEVKTDYIHVGTPGTWTGGTTGSLTDWATATNWENHILPTSSTSVSITPAASYWPTKTGNLTIGSDCNIISMAGSSELTVTGNLTLQSGKTLYVDPSSNAIVRVGGNVNNIGTFTPGLGKVILNGLSNANINSGGSNNLTTMFANTVPNGTSAYFDISATGGIDLSVDAFDINCTTTGSASVEVWYRTGTYVGNTGSTAGWIKVGPTQTVTGQGADNATHVNLPSSVTVPNGSVYGFFISCYTTTTGFMAATSGYNTYNDSYMTIQCGDGCLTQQPGNGSSYPGFTWNGRVYYSYSSGGSLSFWDLEVSKTNADAIISSNTVINNDLTINPTSNLTLNAGKTLTVNGMFTNTSGVSGFRIKSDNSATGSLIHTTNGVDATVERYLTEMKWHYVSPPISDAKLGVFHLPGGHSDIYAKYWDELNEQWVKISDVNLDLNVEQGYAVWVADNGTGQDETIEFIGTLNNNVINPYPLTHTTTNTDIGWNHVGNPYPSALDWDATSGWTKTNTDNTIYYWNPSSGSGNYSYYVGGGTAPWTGGTSVNDGSKFIPAMQGFIVHCNNSSGGSIKIENSARVHDAQSFYKNVNENTNFLRLKAVGNGYWDETVIRFFESATEGFDSDYDAYKLFGLDEAP
ncbi:MAG: S8 family serine peptidase, partial [Bacteroidales bacterium]|nr:S8 family serine peptidase [Bacteroidales bacterium]